MQYGLQLYSVRDVTDKNMEYALEKVAEMGYSFVEFAGFFGIPAKEIKRMLDNTGLRVSGTHTGWQEIAFDFEKTVEYHKEIGNENIIIPGADLSDSKKLDDFINVINEFGPKLAEHGINLHYHNHSFEFQPNKDGQIVHEEMQRRSDILFQIDTYWAYHAGLDPVELIKRLAHRVRIIHLKDGNAKGEGFALGEGTAPVKAVRQAAIELGMTIVVESETLNPDGLSEVKRCIDFLKTLDNE
ncbi:MAG: sugar phosphate isomerase/epimerase family protein [Eubacteriales bacterium]|jgi:sugar phosphate isomerase/epimerase|nr:sugar phosphate isomerase/epimerase [Clostridiales bacterium]